MSEVIAARLYTRGAPESRAVVLAWRGNALEITPEVGTPWLVQAGELAFEARGANHAQLAVRWTESGDARLLMLDERAAQALTDSVPGIVRQRVDRVRGTQGRTAMRSRLSLVAVFVFIVLPASATLAYLVERESLIDWVTARVPPEVEQRLGNHAFDEIRSRDRLVVSGPRFDAMKQIARRLAGPTEGLQFFLVQSPRIDVDATPGGNTIVPTGLFATATDPEQVAGVLAHAVAHIELHQSLRTCVQAANPYQLVRMMFGDWDALSGASEACVHPTYSPEAEHEADLNAIARLRTAQIDPNGLPRFLALVLRSPTDPAVPGWLTAHPASVQRISALDHAIGVAGLAAARPIEIDWEHAHNAPTTVTSAPAVAAPPPAAQPTQASTNVSPFAALDTTH